MTLGNSLVTARLNWSDIRLSFALSRLNRAPYGVTGGTIVSLGPREPAVRIRFRGS